MGSLLGKEHRTSKQVDVLKDTKPEVNMEAATMEKSSASEVSQLISPVDKEFCGASLLSEFIDCNDKEPWQVEAEVSPATTVHNVRKPYASDVLELISPSEEASFGALMVHESVDCNDKSACVVCTDVSYATSVHNDQNTRMVKNDLANDSDCVSDASSGITSLQMSSSAIRCQENMAEVRVGSSCASRIKDFCLPQNPPENLPAYKHLYHDSIDASSSLLTPLLSNEKKLTGALSIVSSNELSMESLGSIDDSIDDVSISSMDTIQLRDEMKLEDSCVIVDSTALYAASRIIRKHSIIQEKDPGCFNFKKEVGKGVRAASDLVRRHGHGIKPRMFTNPTAILHDGDIRVQQYTNRSCCSSFFSLSAIHFNSLGLSYLHQLLFCFPYVPRLPSIRLS
ncbi:uncharacterized protein LOC105761304 isoform X2 [Gossypium raimondii]|uniref:uncharacterized protein LOC105761304 isoform X2 n=1 Tax=Gossypium raimondii TaxID=29730 RepID=UPI00227D69B8|nr:uncharacterized protein LOC105761304 isoform X2 [Gossypium raimondii]